MHTVTKFKRHKNTDLISSKIQKYDYYLQIESDDCRQSFGI